MTKEVFVGKLTARKLADDGDLTGICLFEYWNPFNFKGKENRGIFSSIGEAEMKKVSKYIGAYIFEELIYLDTLYTLILYMLYDIRIN